MTEPVVYNLNQPALRVEAFPQIPPFPDTIKGLSDAALSAKLKAKLIVDNDTALKPVKVVAQEFKFIPESQITPIEEKMNYSDIDQTSNMPNRLRGVALEDAINELTAVNALLKNGNWYVAEKILQRPLTVEEKINRSIGGVEPLTGQASYIKQQEPLLNPLPMYVAPDDRLNQTKPPIEDEKKDDDEEPGPIPEYQEPQNIMSFVGRTIQDTDGNSVSLTEPEARNIEALYQQVRNVKPGEVDEVLKNLDKAPIKQLKFILQANNKPYQLGNRRKPYIDALEDLMNENIIPIVGGALNLSYGLGIKPPKFHILNKYVVNMLALNSDPPRLQVRYAKTNVSVRNFKSQEVSKRFVHALKTLFQKKPYDELVNKLPPHERELFAKLLLMSAGKLMRVRKEYKSDIHSAFKNAPVVRTENDNEARRMLPIAVNVKNLTTKLHILLGEMQTGNDLVPEARQEAIDIAEQLAARHKITPRELASVKTLMQS